MPGLEYVIDDDCADSFRKFVKFDERGSVVFIDWEGIEGTMPVERTSSDARLRINILSALCQIGILTTHREGNYCLSAQPGGALLNPRIDSPSLNSEETLYFRRERDADEFKARVYANSTYSIDVVRM